MSLQRMTKVMTSNYGLSLKTELTIKMSLLKMLMDFSGH